MYGLETCFERSLGKFTLGICMATNFMIPVSVERSLKRSEGLTQRY